MKETDLNIKYICDKTLLNEDDELISIILDMIKESYKSGLCQAEYDNTMGLIEENEKIKLELSGYRQAILSNKEMLGLKEENEELKKQLEEKTKMYQNAYDYSQKMEGKAIILEAQQKEFIKYLEDEIKLYENDIQTFGKNYNVYFSLINDLKVGKARTKDILQKYKEIIGGNKDE